MVSVVIAVIVGLIVAIVLAVPTIAKPEKPPSRCAIFGFKLGSAFAVVRAIPDDYQSGETIRITRLWMFASAAAMALSGSAESKFARRYS